MTPLVSSSPRVRENAEQIETHNRISGDSAILGGARIPRRHRLRAIFPRQGRTGRVQPGWRSQTNQCRPEPAELSAPSRAIPAPAPSQGDFSAPQHSIATTRSVQGYFLPTIPPFPDVAAAGRGPAAVATSGETSTASLPASRPMAPLSSARRGQQATATVSPILSTTMTAPVYTTI